jgi:hypothetical protein
MDQGQHVARLTLGMVRVQTFPPCVQHGLPMGIQGLGQDRKPGQNMGYPYQVAQMGMGQGLVLVHRQDKRWNRVGFVWNHHRLNPLSHAAQLVCQPGPIERGVGFHRERVAKCPLVLVIALYTSQEKNKVQKEKKEGARNERKSATKQGLAST